jgi:trigger factor
MQIVKAVVEDLSPVRKRLEVEVPASEVQSELDRAYTSVGREARIHGFRPGRVPRPVIERMFGEQIRREVTARLVEHSFHHAIEEHHLDVVGSPEIDADGVTPGEKLTYSAVIDVRPVITVGDTKGIEVTRPELSVSDEDVARALDAMREAVAQLRPIEDRGVIESGDVVTVDVTTRLDGGAPQRREGVMLEAGGGTFPLALERQLVGQHKGAHLTLEVPYPDDYGNPGLAGKNVAFEVDVVDLRAKELPPLDDDFARDHARAESLAELRTRTRAELEQEATSRADAAVQADLIERLVERHPFEVPGSLVLRRCDALLAALDVRIPQGSEGETILERLREEVKPRAEREVRSDLLLDAIATTQGIEVGDDALEAEIEGIARRQQQAPERLRAIYERPEARHALRARLRRERALALVLADAKVVPRAMPKDVARRG